MVVSVPTTFTGSRITVPLAAKAAARSSARLCRSRSKRMPPKNAATISMATSNARRVDCGRMTGSEGPGLLLIVVVATFFFQDSASLHGDEVSGDFDYLATAQQI
jgi:hypothetical protein